MRIPGFSVAGLAVLLLCSLGEPVLSRHLDVTTHGRQLRQNAVSVSQGRDTASAGAFAGPNGASTTGSATGGAATTMQRSEFMGAVDECAQGPAPSVACSTRAPGSTCTDIRPPGSGFTCLQQKDFGKCSEPWMVLGNFCALSCNACDKNTPEALAIQAAALAFAKQQGGAAPPLTSYSPSPPYVPSGGPSAYASSSAYGSGGGSASASSFASAG